MSHQLSPLKIIPKIQGNHIIPRHLSLLNNNSKNLSNMAHHLSTFKNNFKNLRKSSHAMSPFSIKNNFENLRSMSKSCLEGGSIGNQT
jgi:hypothetical protein